MSAYLKTRRLLPALVFFASCAAADQIVMKNGDRVTGSIVKQDGKTITIKTANFGVITAPWAEVASIQADQPIHVVLKDGRTVEGTLSTREDKVEVAAKETRIQAAPAEVVAMRDAAEQRAYERLLRPGLGELWAGGFSLGWAGTNGNARTNSFTAALHAARVTRTDKTSLYLNIIKASALIDRKNQATAQAIRAGIGYDHNVSPRLFVNVFNDYEYDRFQDLDLRFAAGGGFGYHLYKGERAKLDVLGGLNYNRSSFSTGSVTNYAEAFWGDDYVLKLNSVTSLNQGFRMFNNLTDSGAYRFNFDLGIATKLRKWLTWNVALSDRYLSNPLPGRKTNDWLYTTGLGVTFGK